MDDQTCGNCAFYLPGNPGDFGWCKKWRSPEPAVTQKRDCWTVPEGDRTEEPKEAHDA